MLRFRKGERGTKRIRRRNAEGEEGREREREREREKTGALVISCEMRVNKKVNGLTARRVQRSRVPKFIVRSCPPHG